jgi:hypothetical protein
VTINVGRPSSHGIEPAPERGKGMPWSAFLKAHWKALAASDFFTVEVWSWSGLATYYVLFPRLISPMVLQAAVLSC